MAVLNDVGVFGAVKHWDRTLGALGSYIVVSWVNGHRHHMDEQVADKHDAGTLGDSSVIIAAMAGN